MWLNEWIISRKIDCFLGLQLIEFTFKLSLDVCSGARASEEILNYFLMRMCEHSKWLWFLVKIDDIRADAILFQLEIPKNISFMVQEWLLFKPWMACVWIADAFDLCLLKVLFETWFLKKKKKNKGTKGICKLCWWRQIKVVILFYFLLHFSSVNVQ